MKQLFAFALALLLAGCGAQQDLPRAPATETAPVQLAVAEAVMPTVLAIREAVEPIAPALPPPAADLVHPDAVALIVHFEILSSSYYEKRLQGVICPGGASGPTWGIGFDGGYQTRAVIAQAWAAHPAVERLEAAAGVIGPAPCRASVAQLRDVRTGLPLAEVVFRETTLPQYHALARRTYRNGWERLPWVTQGVLVSLTYNRGVGMTGDSRREMRTIRDVCVPAGDAACVAREVRAMTRIWEGKDIEDGMRKRRYAEAALAERENV
jgi:GH24 family phage-related lysozyme (muramidase)